MGEEAKKSGLEEVFRKKEEAIQAQANKEQTAEPKETQEAQPAEDIIDEQQVTAQIDKAKKEITD